MKFLKNRVLPFVCALSILISLCVVPASAGNFGGQVELEYPVIEPTAFFDQGLLESEFNRLFGDNSADHCAFFSEFAYIANKNNWSATSYENLVLLQTQWNHNYGKQYSSTASIDSFTHEDGTEIKFVRIKISDSRLGGSRDNWSWCLNDGAGKILVHVPETDDGAANTGQWVPIGYMGKGSFRMMSFDALYNLADDVGGKLIKYNNYYCIKKSSTSAVGDLVYANADGKPYVFPYENDKWASNQDRPTTSVKDEVGEIVEGVIEGITPGINLDNMTVTLPDGTVNIIDELIYDESTKSYTIDSHDTYNTTNNYYLEWNYEWNYYINFTSITYIGQTEEYNKYYEVYYELPDGRDSADLSKEDLEQLNLSIDVIPYGRSADDTSLRSLYHFDGDTKDSSYWNYCTDFTWNKGASLTYMDAAVFEGALYLDELEHDFTCTLPTTIGSGDFTIQWRYYQSHTLTPVADSGMYIGDIPVLQFDGKSIRNSGGVKVADIPTGSWNEICITRKDGNYYVYLNGVCYQSGEWSSGLGHTVRFVFGAEQQTYKYFDELRILNYAIAAGENYAPTAVPHDTNLTLVLPDTAVPVADEYWSITSSGENLFQYDLRGDQQCDFVKVTTTQKLTSDNEQNLGQTFNLYESPTKASGSFYALSADDTSFAFPKWGVNTAYSSFIQASGYSVMTKSKSYAYARQSYCPNGVDFGVSQYYDYWVGSGLSTLLSYKETKNGSYQKYLADGDYLLSVVLTDGSISSFPFTLTDGVPSSEFAQFDWGYIGTYTIERYANGSNTYVRNYLLIHPVANKPIDILHIELIKGTETDLKAEFVSSIVPIDKDSLNTPTLAVRTDEEITSYQIGGVRPSLPKKGMVWALVENERITSIQIYNGQAWEACDGRIWTGERWVPASAYNIITLQDMYDIVDATQDFEYIYSESGFWTWWQKSWNAFQERLFKALESGGGSGGPSTVPGTVKESVAEALSSLIEEIFSTITEVLKSLIGAATDLLSGLFGFLSETVLGGVRDFFSSLDELANPFESTVTDEEGNTSTSTGLPQGISTVFAFFSGLFMIIPEELRIIMMFGFGFLLLLAVFKMIRT